MRLLLVAALLAAVALGAEQQRLMEESTELAFENSQAEQEIALEADKPKKKSKKNEKPAEEAEKKEEKHMVKPVLINKFSAEDAKTAEEIAIKADERKPLESDLSASTNLETLEANIKEQQEKIKDLGEKLEKTYQNKVRLQLLKDMTAAVAALNKAQAYLKKIDSKINVYKAKVQKFADRAQEIVEGMKRSEEEHKKELAENNKALKTIHDGLANAEGDLKKLSMRKQSIAGVEKKWAHLVSVLKQARDNYAATHDAQGKPKPADPAAAKKAQPGLFDEEVPEPPTAESVLSKIGLSYPAAGLRGAAPAAPAPAKAAPAFGAAPVAPAAQRDVVAAANRFSGIDIEREAQQLDAELGSSLASEVDEE